MVVVVSLPETNKRTHMYVYICLYIMDAWDSSFIKVSFLLSGIREVIRK